MEAAIPQNLVGRLLNLLTGLAGSRFEGTKPDILVDDELDLNEYGIAGRIIHTPGHSASSISILLDNGEALVGDMVREQGSGEIGLGMFYEDEQVLFRSLDKVMASEPRAIYLSHGECIDSGTLRDFVETNR
jgi:glyoxylase-like metal-dependent hydrolase (beta-lactamase superfamily II)